MHFGTEGCAPFAGACWERLWPGAVTPAGKAIAGVTRVRLRGQRPRLQPAPPVATAR
jgi:hypothetical protein